MLVLLAGLLLAMPERIPGAARLEALLFPWSTALLPQESKPSDLGVLRLPSAPGASQPQQLEAMTALADALPHLQSRIVWWPNDALRAALEWADEGALLQNALALDSIPQHRLLLPTSSTSSSKDWRSSLIAKLAAIPAAQPSLDSPLTSRWPLVYSTTSEITASAALGALQATQLTWSNVQGLHANEQQLTGPDGYIYLHNRATTPLELSLTQLLEAAPPILLIGAADDPALDAVDTLLGNILHSSYSYSPWWSIPLDKAVILLLLLHYVWIMPRTSFTSGFLLTLLLASGLLALQFGLQLSKMQWPALHGAYGMLLLGYPLAALAASARKIQQAQQLETDQARLALAQQHLLQGELDAAHQQLLKANASSKRLELLYDLAVAYERRRQYDQARSVLTTCLQQNKRFRDVQARLAVLTEVTAPSPRQTSSLTSASTLVMPQAVEKPMLGRYQLERELGRGAMGVVYLGSDPKISRQIAIKTLDLAHLPQAEAEEFKTRFFREAEAAGRLSHPAIVTIYDVGEDGELAFIAMDYAPGQSLSHYTTAEELLPITSVYALLAEVADALDYAHSKGVVHRDIKPANLIYDAATGSVKVTDFGIARMGDGGVTKTGVILGSPSYMAPEQFAGGEIQGTADIFSLGVTFYQLLTGRLPFVADNVAQLAYQLSQKRHQDPRQLRPELPASANRILNKALAKKPADRYQSGRELAAALRRGAPKCKAG